LKYDKSNEYSLVVIMKDVISRQQLSDDTFLPYRPPFLEKSNWFISLQKFFNRYRPAGQIDLEFKADGNLARLNESKLIGQVLCRDVSVCDRNFAYPIEHLTGTVDFTQRDARLNNLEGRRKDVNLSLNGWVKDFGSKLQYEIQIKSDNMALDSKLYNALSSKNKRLWNDFSPSGVARIDLRHSRNIKTGNKSTLEVKLLDAASAYSKFPYPLKNLTGTLLFDLTNASIIASDLVSLEGRRKIVLNGRVNQCRSQRPEYDISVKGNNVALDTELINALPEKERKLCSKIGSAGSINIESLNGRIRYSKEGKYPNYHLLLHSKPVELNNELLECLNKGISEAAKKLQPKGKVRLSAELNKKGGVEYPDYNIMVHCLGNMANFEYFPYQLKDVRGRLKLTRDCVSFEDITAKAADNVEITKKCPTIKINGQLALEDNKIRKGEFKVCADNVYLDERLSCALFEELRGHYTRLSPTGSFDLNDFDVSVTWVDDSERQIAFCGEVEFQNCSFGLLPAVTEINTKLKTKGTYRTSEKFCEISGQLEAGSLRVREKLLGCLKGDINYNKEQRSWCVKNLVGDCYDGKLRGQMDLKPSGGKQLEYSLTAGFEDIDLKEFLVDGKSESKSDKNHNNNYTSGKMSGSFTTTGQMGGKYSAMGRCRLKITDMKVGRLSPLAKLLNVLKLTEPKHHAFDQMLVDSYIKNKKLYLGEVDLSGQFIAFNGSGWMDMEKKGIELTLTARGRRLATAEPSVLQSLTENLGKGVVRMKVSGDFHDPLITTTTLPLIQDTLGIFGTNLSADK